MWCGPHQKPCRNLGRQHQLPFLCPLILSLHHKWPPEWSSTIYPRLSCTDCLKSLPYHVCALIWLMGWSAPWSFQSCRWSLPTSLLPFSKKWEWCFPFFSPTGNFSEQLGFSRHARQTSWWLKSPIRIIGCDHDASFSWIKKLSSAGFPWSDSL